MNLSYIEILNVGKKRKYNTIPDFYVSNAPLHLNFCIIWELLYWFVANNQGFQIPLLIRLSNSSAFSETN